MTRLKLGTLCDFAQIGQMGKLTIVGIFDCININPQLRQPEGHFILPPFYVTGVIAAPQAMAGKHDISVGLLDDDANSLGNIDMQGVPFLPADRNHELQWYFIHGFFGMKLPDYGDYTFEFRVDGQRVGDFSFHVEPTPTTPGP